MLAVRWTLFRSHPASTCSRLASSDATLADVSLLSQLKDRSPYALLGVSSSASASDIKHAFRERVLALHPDRNVHRKLDRQAVEQLRLQYDGVNISYQILSNASLRRLYDRSILHSPLTVPQTMRHRQNQQRQHEEEYRNSTMFFYNAQYAGWPGSMPFGTATRCARPRQQRYPNVVVGAGIMLFVLAGTLLQYWRFSNGSGLVQEALDRENGHTAETLRNVRLRASQRTVSEYHAELKQHAEHIRRLRDEKRL